MEYLAREMPACRRQGLLPRLPMDRTETAAVSVEEDTVATTVAGHGEEFLAWRAGGLDKEWTGVPLSLY